METLNQDLPFEIIQKRVLLFEPFKDLSDSDDKDDVADISFNYDYERQGNIAYLFHIDIGLCISTWANILVRTSFQLPAKEKLDAFLVPELTMTMIDLALITCKEAFMQRCEDYLIPFPDPITFPQDTVVNFSDSMIDLYFNYRKQDDESNRIMIEQNFLSFTPGIVTQLMLKGTLMITEQVLWLHPGFNRQHNREVFPVPMPVYNTIKLKCLQIDDSKIALNMMHSTFLLLCMDCALSLLFGDHAPLLTSLLEAAGFNQADQERYIKETNKFLAAVNENLKESKAIIANLQNRPDWNRIIQ